MDGWIVPLRHQLEPIKAPSKALVNITCPLNDFLCGFYFRFLKHFRFLKQHALPFNA